MDANNYNYYILHDYSFYYLFNFKKEKEMNQRNTSKIKMKQNKNFPYKHRKVCSCGRTYGHDDKYDNGKCPICNGYGGTMFKRVVTKK